MDINSFILGYMKGRASGGGGSSDDVRYVTFRDGAEELYVKPVATGDDCVDVAAKGLIDTPAKESTVDKVFTYSGWALTDGAAANANALKAVDEDRTVYAAYTSDVRTYTVTYYDSDGVTVLKTETLAYGATPSYVPTKDGHTFDGWTPSLGMVVGDASYTAKWIEKITFAGGTWADIARISAEGKASEYFQLGDSRTVPVTIDGTEYSFTVKIVGFDHDKTPLGGTIGISCLMFTVPSAKHAWYGSNNLNNGTTIASALFYSSHVTGFYKKLPLDLQEVIKTTSKTVNKAGSTTQTTISGKIWVPSFSELAPALTTGFCSVSNGTLYPYFAKYAYGYPYTVQSKFPYAMYDEAGNRITSSAEGSVWVRDVTTASGSYMPLYYAGAGTSPSVARSNGTATIKLALGFCI
jgi:hypothetical protein